jgi:hypothetical protein
MKFTILSLSSVLLQLKFKLVLGNDNKANLGAAADLELLEEERVPRLSLSLIVLIVRKFSIVGYCKRMVH